MTFIRQLIERKGNEIWFTSPEDTVYDALLLLAEKNIGALLVIQDGQLVGIVSERDYARKVALQGKTSMQTPVREIMTKNVVTISPQSSVNDAMMLMTHKQFRHLPVIEDDNIIGIISIGDLVKSIIADQAFTINQLEKYITGGQH
ncbi:MAG: CBS domain-containing protein [Chloroflexi bacterium]|nr:CBS domain-containing protein [Chloroflexota bacterium]